jgi:Ca2+-binding EF-hand superfamily protein
MASQIVKITKLFLESYDHRISLNTIRNHFATHPINNSLQSIADLLNEFNIDNRMLYLDSVKHVIDQILSGYK